LGGSHLYIAEVALWAEPCTLAHMAKPGIFLRFAGVTGARGRVTRGAVFASDTFGIPYIYMCCGWLLAVPCGTVDVRRLLSLAQVRLIRYPDFTRDNIPASPVVPR
jgi:hypothetical protein